MSAVHMGKEWQTLQYERKDWDRTHACSGRDTILRHAEPNQSVPPAYTTLNQLAYGAPSAQHPQVQKLLWTGHKENELRMPAAEGRCDLVRAKRQAWEHDVANSPWLTSSRLAADAAAMGGAGAACKRQGCRPAAEGGQPAQIGRKAVGDCAQLFDKTWIQIGLRK
ncbi:hypothetical protein COCSUDRAFT_60072 [Coccomyxa subellipsoidea C-169]|uniref:Uncharacterized protein n=1 Tax=Coccomyxa subellipsoidea (strain C-169) TaxID=574566 RepID=I0YK50_COCSC|nr:hypothetical protein COCSUDRAFT_60072 [Coccomyxa subellipsoidea C-169]EIE18769.1 hypothetical protein COCSUDRAFT_60072 [Coccomyxa subellipsoidea C-169]|eukprot:XP_005643313.1 hypothetical protein COCSUDRAFT_60072 [Coccomyxa subellipsoidea C-169]